LIKHISFDLWLTLIKSHPEFKERRAKFLQKEFNPFGYSAKKIMEIVQSVDKVSDRLNEINGKKVPAEWMYRRILHKLGYDPNDVKDDVYTEIKLKVNELFMTYPPDFLNGSVQPILQTLKDEGYRLNISSNTGFIEGTTIVATLKNLNIFEYFEFCIFSDEIRLSKPSPRFFEKVFEQTSVEKWEVLHVGDNFKADYEGAVNYGFKALHINNQQYTINDIKRHLQKND
jgi:putative hydrolase of the HAD superfamily